MKCAKWPSTCSHMNVCGLPSRWNSSCCRELIPMWEGSYASGRLQY